MRRRLRIGMVTGEFPRLSETFVLDQIVAMHRLGHDIGIVASPPATSEQSHPDVERHELLAHTRYRPQRRGLSPSTAISGGRQLVSGIAHAPHLLPALMTRSNPTSRGQRLRHALPALALGRVDVFHAHFGDVSAALVDALDGIDEQTPIITSFHGFDLTRHVQHHGRRVYERLFARGTLFLPVNQRFRDVLVQLGAPADRTIVHHMGISPSDFPFQGPGEVDGPVPVLSIGRLVEKKGFEYGIRAVAAARARGVELTYSVIGDGPLRADLEELARSLGAERFVRFLGGRTRPEVMQALHEARILLAPSITAQDGDTEGIPVVLMEALASGVPVVASDHSGIPELVEHSRSGLLAPERDVEALAGHLEQLARDARRRHQLAGHGRATVEAEFDRHKLHDRLERLYLAALGEAELPAH